MSASLPPKSSHDAFHGRVNRSPDQPNHHAKAANRAESRIRAPRIASSTTAAGVESSLLGCSIGGDATATEGWAGAVGAGGGAEAAGAGAGGGAGGCGAGGGVDAAGGAAAGWVGVGAGAAFGLLQSALRSRADCSASRKDGAYCSTSGGVCFSAFDSCLSLKRHGLIVPVCLYSR